MVNKVAIIQARISSTRLPGKVLKPLAGKTVLEHIVGRVSCANLVDQVVVATTNNLADKEITSLCKKKGIDYFCGSELNVLERYYKAAKAYNAEVVIRVTSDDPLKDPQVINKAIKIFFQNDYDYVSNTIKPTYPDGLDVEVFSFDALARAYSKAILTSEKEHVTPYIWKNPVLFKLHNFKSETDFSYMRWTLDTEEDYEFIKIIYDKVYKPGEVFLMNDVIDFLEKNPELLNINHHYNRNERYQQDIAREKNFEY